MILLKFLVAGLAMFCIVVAVMYFAQRTLMYLPERQRVSPADAGLPNVEEIVLDTADGEKVVVWYAPPKQDFPLVLYFHGNAGALRHRTERFRALIDAGSGLVALSYRGYGGSSGTPTETGLIADAQAAYNFATTRIAPELTVVPPRFESSSPNSDAESGISLMYGVECQVNGTAFTLQGVPR